MSNTLLTISFSIASFHAFQRQRKLDELEGASPHPLHLGEHFYRFMKLNLITEPGANLDWVNALRDNANDEQALEKILRRTHKSKYPY